MSANTVSARQAASGLPIHPQIPPIFLSPSRCCEHRPVSCPAGQSSYNASGIPRDKEVSDLSAKVGKTLHHHGRRALNTARGILWDVSRRALEKPVFVVGCSRAGTTLVYKTFSESRELGSLQRETHDFWIALHPLAKKDWRSHALGAADASFHDRQAVS